ncbi:hypothetical protein HMPREF0262_02525 [Clostridium sp. ATCC 29733]|nr:hypothetical protein HMPREF0262_02525 [Clostridium sp. ATCC 29733]
MGHLPLALSRGLSLLLHCIALLCFTTVYEGLFLKRTGQSLPQIKGGPHRRCSPPLGPPLLRGGR